MSCSQICCEAWPPQWSASGQPVVSQWSASGQPVVSQWSVSGQYRPALHVHLSSACTLLLLLHVWLVTNIFALNRNTIYQHNLCHERGSICHWGNHSKCSFLKTFLRKTTLSRRNLIQTYDSWLVYIRHTDKRDIARNGRDIVGYYESMGKHVKSGQKVVTKDNTLVT